MNKNIFKIVFEGSPSDEGDVRLHSFSRFLYSLERALGEVDKRVAKGDDETVVYRITDLTHSSPATVEIQATTLKGSEDVGVAICNEFFDILGSIESGTGYERYNSSLLSEFAALGLKPGYAFSKVSFRRNGTRLDLVRDLTPIVNNLIGPDELSTGSVVGRLEAINVHSERRFTIYPSAGPSMVQCIFPATLMEEAIKAFGSNVKVEGKLRYKKIDIHPHRIDVDSIEAYPRNDELPSFFDIEGAWAHVKFDLSPVALVRRLRESKAG